MYYLHGARVYSRRTDQYIDGVISIKSMEMMQVVGHIAIGHTCTYNYIMFAKSLLSPCCEDGGCILHVLWHLIWMTAATFSSTTLFNEQFWAMKTKYGDAINGWLESYLSVLDSWEMITLGIHVLEYHQRSGSNISSMYPINDMFWHLKNFQNICAKKTGARQQKHKHTCIK